MKMPSALDPIDCGCTDCITGYSRPARTPAENRAVGGGRLTIDSNCYPWVAYSGPRFAPHILIPIETPGWYPL